MAMMNETIDVGTGDVFKDLGFADTQEPWLRTELAMRLNEIIKERKLSGTDVSEIFGISQLQVTALCNFKLRDFSSELLLFFITQLDRDIEILIRPKAADHRVGLMSVREAV